MRIVALILTAVLCGGAATSQPTDAQRVEAAKARLVQKTASRQADDDAPSGLTKAQERALRKELEELRAEVAMLKGRGKGEPASALTSITVPESFHRLSANYIARAKSKAAAQASMRKLEADITGYLSSHQVSHEAAEGLWKGIPAVGLDESAVKILGSFQEVGQSGETKLGILTANKFPFGSTYDVAITNGIVSRYAERGDNWVGRPFEEQQPAIRPVDPKSYVR